LHNRNEERKGQIAHLSRDRSDSRFQNLVYLCLDHHDEYDSKTSQSKGFSPDEVREYRDRLYGQNDEFKNVAAHAASIEAAELDSFPELSQYDILRRTFSDRLDLLSRPWRFSLWQTADVPELFAYKAYPADGVCLIERIDIPDGRIVVACVDAAGNPGTSITNAVEELCFQVCARFNIPAERLIWLEHYDDDPWDDWRLVNFRRRPPNCPFEDPDWTVMTSALWKDLRLRPKKTIRRGGRTLESSIIKLFPWPPQERAPWT
jgi:hypothetical protein